MRGRRKKHRHKRRNKRKAIQIYTDKPIISGSVGGIMSGANEMPNKAMIEFPGLLNLSKQKKPAETQMSGNRAENSGGVKRGLAFPKNDKEWDVFITGALIGFALGLLFMFF